jgi:hypothetical protein
MGKSEIILVADDFAQQRDLAADKLRKNELQCYECFKQ